MFSRKVVSLELYKIKTNPNAVINDLILAKERRSGRKKINIESELIQFKSIKRR